MALHAQEAFMYCNGKIFLYPSARCFKKKTTHRLSLNAKTNILLSGPRDFFCRCMHLEISIQKEQYELKCGSVDFAMAVTLTHFVINSLMHQLWKVNMTLLCSILRKS